MTPFKNATVAVLALAMLFSSQRAGAVLIVNNGLDYQEWEDPNCRDFDYRQYPVRCKAGHPDCKTDGIQPDGTTNWERIPPGTSGFPIPWNPGDAINTVQCQIKPAPAPGPNDPATPDPALSTNYPACIFDRANPCVPNASTKGYQFRHKWCLGQTKMVTDSRFAERGSFLYWNADSALDKPEQDSWSLKYDVDCDGLEGMMFDGWETDSAKRQLADDFRSLAGMPPVCRPENDLAANGGNGNGKIDPAECPLNPLMNAGEQEACMAVILPDFPHTVLGYKFYQNVGSHHYTVWDMTQDCNKLDYASNGVNCVGAGKPFAPGESTWNWDTKSCNEVGANPKNVFTGSQQPEMAIPFPNEGPGKDPSSTDPFVGARVGRNHIFLPSTHVLNKTYPQWDIWRSSEMEIWMNVYTADPPPAGMGVDTANVYTPAPPQANPAAVNPTPPQYSYKVVFEVLTGLPIFTPPYTIGVVQGLYFPAEYPTYLFGLSGHAHTRNTLFTADKIPVNPITGHPDADCAGGASPLFRSTTPQEAKGCYFGDFTNTEMIKLEAPGEGLRFQCWTNNGMNAVDQLPQDVRQSLISAAPQLSPRTLKWTCEQFEGVTPGLPIVQAGQFATTVPCKPDQADAIVSDHQPDAECCKPGTGPGTPAACDPVTTGGSRGTGHCVPGHLTWGYSSDDEMCILLAATYELGDGIPTPWPQQSGGLGE